MQQSARSGQSTAIQDASGAGYQGLFYNEEPLARTAHGKSAAI